MRQSRCLGTVVRERTPLQTWSCGFTDGDFLKLVNGKIGPQVCSTQQLLLHGISDAPETFPNVQHAFLMRKLKISGSMALAMKLQPILDAIAPKAKL